MTPASLGSWLLVLYLAHFGCRMIAKHNNQAWPTIPSLLSRVLLWSARWHMLLATNFDEFLCGWRRQRERNPVAPRNEMPGKRVKRGAEVLPMKARDAK